MRSNTILKALTLLISLAFVSGLVHSPPEQWTEIDTRAAREDGFSTFPTASEVTGPRNDIPESKRTARPYNRTIATCAQDIRGCYDVLSVPHPNPDDCTHLVSDLSNQNGDFFAPPSRKVMQTYQTCTLAVENQMPQTVVFEYRGLGLVVGDLISGCDLKARAVSWCKIAGPPVTFSVSETSIQERV